MLPGTWALSRLLPREPCPKQMSLCRGHPSAFILFTSQEFDGVLTINV
jgi:hypothetical protein